MVKFYHTLKKVNGAIHRFNGNIAILIFVALVAIINYQIFTRNVLDFTPQWSEQTALLLMIWLAFLGAAYGVRLRGHISIEFFVKMLPRVLREIIVVAGLLAMLWFSVYIMLIHGWHLTEMMMNQFLPSIPIKVGYSYLAIPVSGLLMFIYIIEDILELLIKE